jgi:hypothetical protein
LGDDENVPKCDTDTDLSHHSVWRHAMMQTCCFRHGNSRASPARVDLHGPGCPAVEGESTSELGYKARLEVERFINGNLHDSTIGWPLLTRMPRIELEFR